MIINKDLKPFTAHFLMISSIVLSELPDELAHNLSFEQEDHLYAVYKTRHIQRLFKKGGLCESLRKNDFPRKFTLGTLYQMAILKREFRKRSKLADHLLTNFKEKASIKEEANDDNLNTDFQTPAHLLEAKPYEVDENSLENTNIKGENGKAIGLDITFSTHNFFIQLKELIGSNTEKKSHAYLSGGSLSKQHKVDQALKSKRKTKDKPTEATESRLKNKRTFRKEVQELTKNLLAKHKNLIDSASVLVVTVKGNQEDRDNLLQPLLEHILTSYKTPLFMDLKTFKVFNGCKASKKPNK